MKKYFLLLTGLLLVSLTSAQSVETIFGKGGPKVRGAYGVAAQKFCSIDGQFANFLGGYGGVMFENGAMVGADAFALLHVMGAGFVGKQDRLPGGGAYFTSSRGAFVKNDRYSLSQVPTTTTRLANSCRDKVTH
jgi:hypothetical protein